MATSIGGLGSGIDTTSLVATLMQAEAATQTKLKGAKGTLTVKAGAWGSLSTIVKGLHDKASALSTDDKVRLTTSSSSNSGIATATSLSTAPSGTLTFRVMQLATRHQVATAGTASATSPLSSSAGTYVVTTGLSTVGATLTAPASGSTGKHVVVISRPSAEAAPTATVNGVQASFGTDAEGRTTLEVAGATLTFAGTPQSGTAVVGMVATTPTTSLADIAAGITALGVAGASVIQDGTSTPFRLVLSANETGTGATIQTHSSDDLAALAATSTVSEAKNARVEIGDRSSPIVVERSSNDVADLMPGVTLNLVKADPATDVTVTVKRDDDALVSKVKGLSDSINGLLAWIATNSKYDVAAKKGGPMVGDSGVRTLASQVASAVQTVVGEGPYRTMNGLGLTANRTGTYDLDEAKLREALKADPDAVARVLAAASDAISSVAKAANEPSGIVKKGQESVDQASRQLQTRIDEWDLRLKAVRDRYTRQFNALDVAMSRMNSQSSWLAGQLKGLPSSSS